MNCSKSAKHNLDKNTVFSALCSCLTSIRKHNNNISFQFNLKWTMTNLNYHQLNLKITIDNTFSKRLDATKI